MPTTTPSVEDRLLIAELSAKYAWALDTCDTEAFIACFTPDALFGDIGVTAKGHKTIRKLVKQRYHENPIFAGRQHQISQTVFLPNEDGQTDRWSTKSFAQVLVLRDIGPYLYWVGYYYDTVLKVDGQWLFEERLANKWMGEVLSKFPRDSIAPLIMERPAGFFDPVD